MFFHKYLQFFPNLNYHPLIFLFIWKVQNLIYLLFNLLCNPEHPKLSLISNSNSWVLYSGSDCPKSFGCQFASEKQLWNIIETDHKCPPTEFEKRKMDNGCLNEEEILFWFLSYHHLSPCFAVELCCVVRCMHLLDKIVVNTLCFWIACLIIIHIYAICASFWDSIHCLQSCCAWLWPLAWWNQRWSWSFASFFLFFFSLHHHNH